MKSPLTNFLLLVAFLANCLYAVAQKDTGETYSKQFSFCWDNDYFALKGTDRYYTNGLYFAFDKVNLKKKDALKRIDHVEFGQTIYKQYLRRVTRRTGSGFPGGIAQIDRPITGYLFAKVGRTVFSRNHLWNFGASIGAIGPLSLGEQVQTFWHKESGVGDYWDWVWDYQLKSEPGINFHGKYATALIKNPRSFLQITPISDATLGSIFTNLNQSVLLQIGKFNAMSGSGFWNANIESPTATPANKPEIFVYAMPTFSYHLYNATIQGGMFRNNKGPIVSTLEPVVLMGETGVMITASRYSANLAVFFQSKEASTQFNSHSWGRVKVAYRLK